MRTGRKIIGALLVLAVLLSAAVAIIDMTDNDEVVSLSLYFLNENTTSICEEKRDIRYNSEDDIADEVLKELRKGSKSKENTYVMSKSTEWTISTDASRLLVDFSQDFLTQDNAKNLLSTYAVVKSLCSIDGVEEVKVTVAGGELVAPDASRIDYLSDRDINLENEFSTNDKRNIKLYYLSGNGYLDAEWRNVTVTNTAPVEQYIVAELIKGTEKEGLFDVLSPDTVLISVEVTDATAYVNLTNGFIERHKGDEKKEYPAVYSIVNSLTELEDIDGVQFLVEGKKISGLNTIDLSVTLMRNEALINTSK